MSCKGAVLKRFEGKHVHRIIFCEDEVQKFEDGVQFYPLGEVFSRYCSTSVGQIWLKSICS
jgi:hypothetical protein